MENHIESEIQKYARLGVLIDTNLYVLLLVGRTNMQKVGTDKRTKEYVIDDYIVLENTIRKFEKRYTTPNIVTESSNLLGAGKRTTVHGVNNVLANDINIIGEEHISSLSCVSQAAFFRFGVTDTAIVLIASRKNILILTDDLPLYSFLAGGNLPVVNFNHVRPYP